MYLYYSISSLLSPISLYSVLFYLLTPVSYLLVFCIILSPHSYLLSPCILYYSISSLLSPISMYFVLFYLLTPVSYLLYLGSTYASTSFIVITFPERIINLSTTLRSSLILPVQLYCCNAAIAFLSISFTG